MKPKVRLSMFEGTKFKDTKDLNIVEIAKLIRKEIKATLPTLRASVVVQKYSMGQSLNITIDNKQHKDKVKEIAEQYNFDNSDPMIDYSSNKFFTFVY